MRWQLLITTGLVTFAGRQRLFWPRATTVSVKCPSLVLTTLMLGSPTLGPICYVLKPRLGYANTTRKSMLKIGTLAQEDQALSARFVLTVNGTIMLEDCSMGVIIGPWGYFDSWRAGGSVKGFRLHLGADLSTPGA